MTKPDMEATADVPRKPHLLLCFAGVTDGMQSLLDQHFVVHPLVMPEHMHPKRTGQLPRLPIPEGEGRIERDGAEWVAATSEQAIEYVGRHQVDAILFIAMTPCPRQLIEAASPRLKHLACISVGFNHVDLQAAADRGILVTYTPGVPNDTTADLVVGLMLATARRFAEASQAVKDGTWTVWRHPWLCGKDVHGSTVGLVGLGRIAQRLAKRLKAFDCHILYTGPREKPKEAAEVGAEYVSFDELLGRSDFVVPLCPLLPSTTRMFGAAQFERMKRDAVFINAARGAIVDHQALLTALQSGTIAAAGLDVTDPEPLPPDHPLCALDNCFITPHIGVSTAECVESMFMTGAQNLVYWMTGQMDKAHVVPAPSQRAHI